MNVSKVITSFFQVLVIVITINVKGFSQDLIYCIDGYGAFFSIDPQTCTKSFLANTWTLPLDIAYNPIDGNFYTTGERDLYKIDSLSYQISHVTPFPFSTNALTCTKQGTILSANYSCGIFSMDLATTTITCLSNVQGATNPAGDIVLFNGAYYISDSGGKLLKVSTNDFTQFTTVSTNSLYGNMYSLATIVTPEETNLYGFSGVNLYKIDTTDFSPVLQCPNIGYFNGATSKSETTVYTDSYVDMPNVFTPNNDGVNDTFIPIKVKNVSSAELQVYNRWGKLVFKTVDIFTGWDGNEASEGVYFWSIKYTDTSDANHTAKGNVSILK